MLATIARFQAATAVVIGPQNTHRTVRRSRYYRAVPGDGAVIFMLTTYPVCQAAARRSRAQVRHSLTPRLLT